MKKNIIIGVLVGLLVIGGFSIYNINASKNTFETKYIETVEKYSDLISEVNDYSKEAEKSFNNKTEDSYVFKYPGKMFVIQKSKPQN